MALKTCTRPAGSVGAYGKIEIRLSQDTFVTATGAGYLASPINVTAAADGSYSVQLQATNDLTPNGTFFIVSEFAGTTDNTLYVQVPQTAGPFVLTSIQVSPLPTAAPSPNHVSTLIVDIGPLTLPAASIADAALSSNVDLLNANQTITGVKLTAEEFRTAKNPYDPRYYGAKIDGQFIGNGVMNGTTAVLTSASNPFVAADVGKLCLVPGAGAAGGLLTTTIASYQSPGQVTLAAVSQTAVGAALVTWGSDDSAAWVTTYAAAPAGARILIPTGYSLYQGSFMGGITKSLSLEGLGVAGLRNAAVSVDVGVSPYLAGSVLVQCQAGANGMDITGSGIAVHRRNFGIKFADGIKFRNTGHGIYSVTSGLDGGGGHLVGEAYCESDNVMVFGHDGNHYGYYCVNPVGIKNDLFYSEGGGVMYIECDSTAVNLGNAVITSPFGVLFCGGSAHGYTLKGAATNPGILNFITWDRPQVNIEAVPAAFAGLGITNPTVAQYLWRTLGPVGSVTHIGITDPDLEGWAYSNPIDFGNSTSSNRTRVTSGAGVLSAAPSGGFPQLNVDGGLSWPSLIELILNGSDVFTTQAVAGQHIIGLTPITPAGGISSETIGLRVLPPTITVQGNYATQRHVLVNVPVYNTHTITDAATLAIEGAPGGTATYTRKYQLWLQGTDAMRLDTTTAATVGAAGGASALPATPLGYLPIYVGSTQVKVPYYNP